MLLSSSISRPYLNTFGVEKSIELMANAGFDAIDFPFGGKYCSPETDSDAFKEYFLKIREMIQEKGLHFNQAHAPAPSSHIDETRDQELFENLVRSIRNASYLGVPTIVVHPVQHLTYDNDENPERLFEMNIRFYNRLKPYCEEYGIKIALENMWQYIGKKISHSTCSRPDEFNRYLDALDSNHFVGCLDIGHAFLVGESPSDFIRNMGNKRLRALHIHDVDGFLDSHTLPFQGAVNWERTVKALADIEYQGDLTYEANGFLTRTPFELYSSALRHMVEIGRYLIRKFQDYSN